jgi:gluconate 2-dehydrogenase alpha chain
MSPLRSAGFIDHMFDTAKRLGWHPFHPPAAINTQTYGNRPGCAYHGFCSAGGCHINAKNSTAITTIPAALKTKNLTIFDLAHVTRIGTDSNGRATGVSYVRNREEFFQPARVILLAGYTYENSRLLLLSKSRAFPDGLSNHHGQVGKHFFAHYQTAVTALFPFDVNIWYGLPAQGVTVDDFADDVYDHTGLNFIGGTSLARAHRAPRDRGRRHVRLQQSSAMGRCLEEIRARERGARGDHLSSDLHVSL